MKSDRKPNEMCMLVEQEVEFYAKKIPFKFFIFIGRCKTIPESTFVET